MACAVGAFGQTIYNVWAINGSADRAQIYDHPAHDWFVRDIEPSVLVDPPATQVRPWWQPHSLDVEPVEEAALAGWPFRGELPYSSDWLEARDPDGQRWLLLHGLFTSREEREEASPANIAFRRSTFVRVSSIIVRHEHVRKVCTQLDNARLSDPTDHNTIDWADEPFFCEYP